MIWRKNSEPEAGRWQMALMKEFKEFAIKGNVIDMAVGIIIGAAFGAIVSSFVADVVMPPVGALLGGVDFSNLVVVVRDAVNGKPPVVMRYGRFIMTIINFLIIAFVIFLAVKAINAMRREQAAAPPVPPAPTREEALLAEIRDLLKEKR
jgi:large conductance mechanosensitive channel